MVTYATEVVSYLFLQIYFQQCLLLFGISSWQHVGLGPFYFISWKASSGCRTGLE